MANTAATRSLRRKNMPRRGAKKRLVRAKPDKSPKSLKRHWKHDALALLYSAAALYVLLACLLFQFNLAESLLGREGKPATVIGRVGEIFALFLGQYMGYCSLVVILWCCGYAFFFWKFDEDTAEERQWISVPGYTSALIGFFITACSLAWLVGGESTGGILGSWFMRLPSDKIGKLGAGIVAFAVFLFCLGIVSGRSVPHIISRTLRVLGRGSVHSGKAVYLGGILSGRLLRRLHFLIKGQKYEKSFDELSPVWEKSITDEDPGAGSKAGKKRSSHATSAEDSDLDDDEDFWEEEYDEEDFDEDDEDDEEEEYSHVVVTRRESRAKGAKQKVRNVPPAYDAANYVLPDTGLLTRSGPSESSENDEELLAISRQIESKLKDFSVHGRVTEVHPGPVVTLFEFEPAPGVKVGKIASLQDDLAMSLKASSLRIVAPIPRKGTVGIEVPNKHRDIVRLGDLIDCEGFIDSESLLTVPIGKDTYGEPFVADVATMPHLLMAGATGTGKSVLINSFLLSLLYRATPEELGLILIDPKVLELSVYDGIPHLRVPVVTVPRQAKAVLDWAVREMERRYRLMQRFGVRSIDGYNRLVKGEPEGERRTFSEDVIDLDEEEIIQEGTITKDDLDQQGIVEQLQPLPKIVIVIDELADLMLTVGREIEELITRLAQKARAAGLHLIVATQRPSVDVITGLIKANFPARLSFRVASRIDSRTILDCMGAEKLLGKGDMLFMMPGGVALKRVHGAFVSDTEVKRVIEEIKKNGPPSYDARIMEICEKALTENESSGGESGGEGEYDAFYDKAVELVMEKGQASTSMIQRAFRIGYNRAARIIEMMEHEGVIGPMDGVKPREVLVPGRGK